MLFTILVFIFIIASYKIGGALVGTAIIYGMAICIGVFMLWVGLPSHIKKMTIQYKFFTDVSISMFMMIIGGTMGVTSLLAAAYAGIFLSLSLRLASWFTNSGNNDKI